MAEEGQQIPELPSELYSKKASFNLGRSGYLYRHFPEYFPKTHEGGRLQISAGELIEISQAHPEVVSHLLHKMGEELGNRALISHLNQYEVNLKELKLRKEMGLGEKDIRVISGRRKSRSEPAVDQYLLSQTTEECRSKAIDHLSEALGLLSGADANIDAFDAYIEFMQPTINKIKDEQKGDHDIAKRPPEERIQAGQDLIITNSSNLVKVLQRQSELEQQLEVLRGESAG